MRTVGILQGYTFVNIVQQGQTLVHLQSSKVSVLLLFQHIYFSFILTLATTSNTGQMHVQYLHLKSNYIGIW